METAEVPVTYAGATVDPWVPLVLLGLVTAALSYTTGIAAIRRLGSRLASFVALSEVVAGVLWAWWLLDELPRPVQLLGGLLILGGVVLVKLGERDVARPEPDPAPVSTAQRVSWRRMKTSRVSIRRAAATGTASRAPMTPSSEAPASAATTVTEPGTSTVRVMILG